MKKIVLTAVALSGLALAGCEVNVDQNTANAASNAGDSIENTGADLINGASNIAARAA